MLNFMREKTKNNSEEILWYSLDYDLGYILQVYRAEICSNKIKQRRIYWKNFLYSSQRKEKINWWEKQGAISEEEFALKYK